MRNIQLVGGEGPLLHGPPNTPILETKGSYTASSHPYSAPAYKLKWNADQLEADVVHELSCDVFCDVAGFLEEMFPVPLKLVDKVLANALKFQLYDGSGSEKRWSGYTTEPPNHESDLYAPFVTLVKSIAGLIPKSGATPNDVQWRDYHNTRPLSRDRYAADIRPDIVATIGVKDEQPVPWSRVVVPVEMKKQVRDGPALLQLLKYMRMVFHESMDRCFVLGIVVACTNMSVYLADRTGVLGSVVFNIHEKPELLIRVIVGICTLLPADLGWDTSMSVIREQQKYSRSEVRRLKFERSYAVPWNPEKEDHYWVIDMPKQKEGAEYGVMDENKTETFVLYKGLNVQRGEVIRGRATRIWKAWLLDDLSLPQEDRPLFIVKDTWRDDERRLEGEFYAKIGRTPGVATMRSYGVVYVGDQEDTVASRIRRGLHVYAKPRCIDMAQKGFDPNTIPSSTPDRTRGNTTDYGSLIDYLPLIDVPERSPRGRTHSRLVMETYGWPIKMGLTLLETVQAMRDALVGHWTAFKMGVLHRDLSEGNILITGSKKVGFRGVIIDMDYAKFSDDPTLAEDPISGTRPFMSGEILRGEIYSKASQPNDDVDFFAEKQAPGTEDEDGVVTQPKHTFFHDLESIFWILLWICICRAGPAMRRSDLWDPSKKILTAEYTALFRVADLSLLGFKKETIIMNFNYFDKCLKCVADYYRPLIPLLQRLWVILHKGYEKDNFDCDDTYGEFVKAFERMEQLLLAKPEVRTSEQEVAFDKEEKRREADHKDWERTPRKLSKQPTIHEDNEADEPPLIEDPAPVVRDAGIAGGNSDDERDPSPSPAPRGRNAVTNPADLELKSVRLRTRQTSKAANTAARSESRSSAVPSTSNAQTPPPSDTAGSSQSMPTRQTRSTGRGRSNQSTQEGSDVASGSRGRGGRSRGGQGARAARGRGARGKGKGKEGEPKRR